MNILEQVEKIAFDSGFSEYGYVKIDDLKYYQEVRTICEGNSCRNYAASWACPCWERYCRRRRRYRFGR